MHAAAESNEVINFYSGNIPLLISMPHVGTDLPDEIACNLTPQALEMADEIIVMRDGEISARHDMRIKNNLTVQDIVAEMV